MDKGLRAINAVLSFRGIWHKVVEKVCKVGESGASLVSVRLSLVSMGGPTVSHISTTPLRAALHRFTAKLSLIYILYNIIVLLSIVLLYLYLLYIY